MLRKGYLAEADIVETIYILNPDLTILAVSSSVKALLGYRPEELVGRKLTGKDIIAPEYVTVLQEHLKGLLVGDSITLKIVNGVERSDIPVTIVLN